MAEPQKQLVLTFENGLGQESKINIRSPAEPLSINTIREAMDQVISIGAFGGNYEIPVVYKKSASYVYKEEQPVKLK